MREVTVGEYLDFVSRNRRIIVGGQEVDLSPIEVRRLEPSTDELTDVSTTIWSFPKRGSWATHRGDYRGNWPPQMARALILGYTEPGEIVLDPMAGSGTTCIEAVLLGRKCIAVDINYNAVMLTHHRLYYLVNALRKQGALPGLDAGGEGTGVQGYRVFHGDARRLDEIRDNTVDLVATHPPYFNIIGYGGNVDGDLSNARTLEEYLEWLREVAGEIYRVLKPGRYCGILIGDTRVHGHYVPITHYALEVFLDAGFILKEEVIKIQHKMKTTREVWNRLRKRNFLLIYHEKLFVFRKPGVGEDTGKLRYSMKLPVVKLMV